VVLISSEKERAVTSKLTNPQEKQAAEPEVEKDQTALDAEQLDEVRGDGAYPLTYSKYITTGIGG